MSEIPITRREGEAPAGAVIVLGAALELLATLRVYASMLPGPVVDEMARFSVLVAEHVEVK